MLGNHEFVIMTFFFKLLLSCRVFVFFEWDALWYERVSNWNQTVTCSASLSQQNNSIFNFEEPTDGCLWKRVETETVNTHKLTRCYWIHGNLQVKQWTLRGNLGVEQSSAVKHDRDHPLVWSHGTTCSKLHSWWEIYHSALYHWNSNLPEYASSSRWNDHWYTVLIVLVVLVLVLVPTLS